MHPTYAVAHAQAMDLFPALLKIKILNAQRLKSVQPHRATQAKPVRWLIDSSHYLQFKLYNLVVDILTDNRKIKNFIVDEFICVDLNIRSMAQSEEKRILSKCCYFKRKTHLFSKE